MFEWHFWESTWTPRNAMVNPRLARPPPRNADLNHLRRRPRGGPRQSRQAPKLVRDRQYGQGHVYVHVHVYVYGDLNSVTDPRSASRTTGRRRALSRSGRSCTLRGPRNDPNRRPELDSFLPMNPDNCSKFPGTPRPRYRGTPRARRGGRSSSNPGKFAQFLPPTRRGRAARECAS